MTLDAEDKAWIQDTLREMLGLNRRPPPPRNELLEILATQGVLAAKAFAKSKVKEKRK
jgi:hypothetical protein